MLPAFPKGLGSKVIAEGIGTFAMVFMGCGSLRLMEIHPGVLPAFFPAVIFGSTVAAMIYSVGHLSGAHFNPAVTTAFALTRHFPWRQVPAYWLGQFAGSAAACGALAVLMPGSENFGSTVASVSPGVALGWEILLTFFLMFVIISVATDTRAEGTLAGLAIGITVTIGAAVGGPFSGASMNPARSLGPALFTGDFAGIWIYFLGPVLGAALGAWVYQRIRCESDSGSAQGCC